MVPKPRTQAVSQKGDIEMNLSDAWNEVKSLWPDGRYLSIEAMLTRSAFNAELQWQLYVTGLTGGNRLEKFGTLDDLVAAARIWAQPTSVPAELTAQCALVDGIEDNVKPKLDVIAPNGEKLPDSFPQPPGPTIGPSGCTEPSDA